MANYITAALLDLATYVSLWVVHIRSLMILPPRPQFYFISFIYLFLLIVLQPNAGNSSSVLRFLHHTWGTTVGRIPLDEWSACRI